MAAPTLRPLPRFPELVSDCPNFCADGKMKCPPETLMWSQHGKQQTSAVAEMFSRREDGKISGAAVSGC